MKNYRLDIDSTDKVVLYLAFYAMICIKHVIFPEKKWSLGDWVVA